jgi:hypothetical protein
MRGRQVGTSSLTQAVEAFFAKINKCCAMRRILQRIFNLDLERSIWVEEEELGKKKAFYHKDKRYFVKIPEKINHRLTLRLRGYGKSRRNKTGDLFLHVWLNKGEDINKSLWLSETCARNGANKRLLLEGKAVTMIIPPGSYNGLTIRLKGYGREVRISPDAPALQSKNKGNALVKLNVYPDTITPRYGSFETLSTENMALEGWVYRKFDKVISTIGKASFPAHALQAGKIADLFNEWGLWGIFDSLVYHLGLSHLGTELTTSAAISAPGYCKTTADVKDNKFVGYNYLITINEQFLDNPFSIAAILAHELCHVVYSERIDETPKTSGYVLKTEKAKLEEERTVDLLVFMFKIGEFQLRVARDKRLTLGYFNQEVFDRMQVIVSKKLNSI